MTTEFEGGSMPAYWVARSRIIDPVEYKKYTDPLPALFAKYGGKVLARGGRYQIMEGPDTFHRFVVIEFPTFEQGVACFTSDEYNTAAAFRRNGRRRGGDDYRRRRRRDAMKQYPALNEVESGLPGAAGCD
jgi:uncharacterized protein (DUF1330 family)